MNEFDKWREGYDTMSLTDQVAYHNDLESRYPDQKHYDYDSIAAALLKYKPKSVLEFGCWKGDLAKQALEQFDIDSWKGIEICESAIEKKVCSDERFIIEKPYKFDWWHNKKAIADMIIATHFIEHLSNEHMIQLADFCSLTPVIYFEAPITDEGQTWQGYEGTHKLEYGWNQIVKLFPNHSVTKFNGGIIFHK